MGLHGLDGRDAIHALPIRLGNALEGLLGQAGELVEGHTYSSAASVTDSRSSLPLLWLATIHVRTTHVRGFEQDIVPRSDPGLSSRS